ncbi:gp53-like domain-containing protein [Pseudomonas retamae]|uniref:Phage tail protein n=1 Tax=Pseudomonas retamae TaxID=702110 RepID=A0ABW7DB54_9PSED|nr:Phage tail fiber protein [Pseudomonas fluorescens]
MDYPKSMPGVGLVNSRFVDENPVTGTPGSLIPAEWGNALTEEILTVIKAAGIEPTEGLNTQLLEAIRSKKLFETPPQFDASQKVATTEFVQRALGSLAGQTNYVGEVSLTAADVGRLSIFTGPSTATLPEWSTVPAGGLISLCASSGGLTVKARTGETLGTSNGASPTSLSFVGGSFVTFRRLLLGGGWGLDAGDGALKYSPVFTASLATAGGYQRLPSGLILQWGLATGGGLSETITYPIAFPNAVLFLSGGDISPGFADLRFSLFRLSQSQFQRFSNMDPGGWNWFAIGF